MGNYEPLISTPGHIKRKSITTRVTDEAFASMVFNASLRQRLGDRVPPHPCALEFRPLYASEQEQNALGGLTALKNMFTITFKGEIFPTITCQKSHFLRAHIKCPCSKYVPKVHLRVDIILVTHIILIRYPSSVNANGHLHTKQHHLWMYKSIHGNIKDNCIHDRKGSSASLVGFLEL